MLAEMEKDLKCKEQSTLSPLTTRPNESTGKQSGTNPVAKPAATAGLAGFALWRLGRFPVSRVQSAGFGWSGSPKTKFLTPSL
jgi:hypothetical protein